MADVNFTENSVLAAAGTNKRRVKFGATITQGMALYYDETAGESDYKIADCTDAAKDAASAIALTSGVDGQYGFIMESGNLTCDNVAPGVVYMLSTSGGVCPHADFNLATDYCTVVGTGTSATNLKVGFIVSGYKTP